MCDGKYAITQCGQVSCYTRYIFSVNVKYSIVIAYFVRHTLRIIQSKPDFILTRVHWIYASVI